jgi:hypothetical protein
MEYNNISLCLITKDPVYPLEILQDIQKYPWGEILILTHSDSPYRKHELFAKAKNEVIAYQDDDAIVPWGDIMALSRPNIINVAMKESHFEAYKGNRATMGLGWGAIFPKSILQSLDKYVSIHGVDDVFKRETERILTYLNFPQNRLLLPIIDLPSAYAEDRLWRQPQHVPYKQIAEERCSKLI